jgi:hypothetical protein
MSNLLGYALLIVLFFAVIFYYYMEGKSKRDLKKLEGGYNKNDDKSRPSELFLREQRARDNTKVISREPNLERDEQSQGRIILPPTVNQQPGTDKPEPIIAPKKMGRPRKPRFGNVKKIEELLAQIEEGKKKIAKEQDTNEEID